MRSILLIVAIAVLSIFISHRSAGPVYQFESTIKALARGDEFYDLADAINSLIKSMKR